MNVNSLRQKGIAYHVTTEDNLQSILKSGLVPMVGQNSTTGNEMDPAVYLFASREDVETALYGWLGECLEDAESEVVILEIHFDKLPELTRPEEYEIKFMDTIPPNAIHHVFDENWNAIRLNEHTSTGMPSPAR